MNRFLLSTLIFLFSLSPSTLFAQAWAVDFSKATGSGQKWFKSNGFELQRDADDIKVNLKDGKMIFQVNEKLGLFNKKLNLSGITKIKIRWGVNQFPQGAEWEKGVLREAISVVLSFGTKKIDSGSFAVPNVPYFISFFLGEKETEGKAYVGNYYKEGGRYFCSPCGAKKGTTVTTEIQIADLFKKEFGKSNVPNITGLALEIDTRDTEGNAEAFIESIELL